MNIKQKITAAAMIPLINGQSVFEQKTETLKADLENMMLDIEEPTTIEYDQDGNEMFLIQGEELRLMFDQKGVIPDSFWTTGGPSLKKPKSGTAKYVAFKSAHDNFMKARPHVGTLVAFKDPKFTVANKFKPVYLGNHTIGLKSQAGKGRYVVCENTGAANADRGSITSWEMFQVYRNSKCDKGTKDCLSFKSTAHKKWLVAEPNGQVNCNRDKVSTWEKWYGWNQSVYKKPKIHDYGLIRSGWCGHAGSHVSWADLDGDGFADMICDDKQGRHWALLGNGKGGFKADLGLFEKNFCRHEGSKIHWSDYTGDGKADMLCSDELGKHTGKLMKHLIPGEEFELDDKFCRKGNFKWVDMNGNGKFDMVCDYPGSGSHWSQYSDGNGHFVNMGDLEKRFCHAHDFVSYADINGDGNQDIICSHPNGVHRTVILDGQSNQLESAKHIDVIAENFCLGNPKNVHFADINGDKKEDMLCDMNGQHWIKLSQGDGTFEDARLLRSGWCNLPTAYVNWVDLDGDGRAELTCTDGATGRTWALGFKNYWGEESD